MKRSKVKAKGHMKRRYYLSLALLTLISTVAEADEARLMSNTRQLTFEGRRAGEGYFSNDGTKMIFQSEREPGNPFYQMYVLDMDTGDTERISPGHGKTTCGWIHPDGIRVLFASTHDDPEAKAKQKAELDFRASGKSRRYSWDYDEHYDIFEYDAKKGAYRNLTNVPGYDAEGAYSPDGRKIVFASNRAAYARDLTPEEKKTFEHDKSYFMDVYVMDADGKNVKRLTDSPGYDGGTFFSADGTKITWRRFSEDGAQAEVHTMNTDGTDQRQITRLGVMSWAPYFHPSDDYLVFTTNKHGFGNFELYIVDAAGRKTPRRVTFTKGFDGLPAFSPDGGKITWTSNRTPDKKSQIFIADWNDAEARRLLGLESKVAAAVTIPSTEPKITEKDVRAHVAALASADMEGRLTGTAGERKATAYVAEMFDRIGLEPAGDNGTWFQEFTFNAGASLGTANSLSLEGAKLDRTWRPLAFSKTGRIGETEVAFAGYGIVAPTDGDQKAYDSYGDLDVRGKWVLVWRGLPQDAEPKRKLHLTRYSELQYKASEARKRGARGLIVAPAHGVPYKDPLVRFAYDSTGGTSSLVAISVDGATSARQLARAGKDAETLTRDMDSGKAVPGFAIPGVRIAVSIDIVRERRTGRNVLARLPADRGVAGPAVMIGAHVDHLGRGETSGSLAREQEKGQVHYGADDNASGIAAMLEIAQHLAGQWKSGKLKARRDILFAAWSGEELGLLGSGHYVRALAPRKSETKLSGRIGAYLNMDMVGRLNGPLQLFGVGSSPIWKREIERSNVPVGLSIVTKNDSYLPTDATSFYLKGVPILHAFTGVNSEYSTPRDTANRLNYPGLVKVARLMGGIARGLARSAEAPVYVKLAAPKGQGGRKRAKIYLGTIPDYAEEGAKGVKISGTSKDSPAEKAGLKGGDYIVRLAGIDIENIYDFVNILNTLKIGKAEELVVVRGGVRVSLTITPAARE